MFQVHIADKVPRKSPMSLGRCDQCSKRHRKCSLDLPTCSNCQKLGITCTRERTFKYVLSSSYADITKTRPKKPNPLGLGSAKELNETQGENSPNDNNFKFRTKTKRDFGQPVIIINENHTSPVTIEPELETEQEPETKYFNEEDKLNKVLKNWRGRSYSRSDLIYFTKVAGIKLTDPKSLRFSILNKLLNKRILPREGRRPKLLHIEPPEIDKEKMFDNALSAYFHYVNPFFPLFTKEGFNLKSRSTLLKHSLWRVGLQFLPHSTYNETITHMLDSEILKLVKLSKVTTSLDTIQALLALRNGIFEFPLYESLSSFFTLATTLVTLLGLHATPPNFLSPSNILEREFALKQTLITSSDLLYKRGIDFLNLNDGIFYNSFDSNLKYDNLCLNQEFFRDLTLSSTEMDGALENEIHDTIYKEVSKQKLYERLLWILSHCTYKGSKVLRQCALRILDITYSKRNHDLTRYKSESESKLNHFFIWGISELDTIENSVVNLDNIDFNIKSELSLFISQVRLVLMLRSRFMRIQLIDLVIGYNLLVTNSNSGTSLAKKGIQASTMLIDLIALIGKGPFLLDRDFMLGIATRFLAQNCQCAQRNLISINHSILKANNELTKLQEYAITGYFIEGCKEILDSLIKRNKY